MTHVLTEIADDAIATLTLDHERRRNALSHALVEEVLAALQAFRQAKARVVVLRARPGAKVFSAGHDVDELPEARRDPLGWDDPLRRWCARSRASRHRWWRWSRAASGAGRPRPCSPAT